MTIAILWGCALISVVVFGVMIRSIATFHAAQNTTPANFRPHPLIEVIWALIPIAIFIGAVLPAVKIVGTADARVAEASE
jgi:heme/copper-type cytochrome/quinol oxidase subunit 2